FLYLIYIENFFYQEATKTLRPCCLLTCGERSCRIGCDSIHRFDIKFQLNVEMEFVFQYSGLVTGAWGVPGHRRSSGARPKSPVEC
ncbi:MAG TPA: hypothetical protein VNJ47_14040, partial [Nevskiales bacterium]|nr:hypothetical protein [Nevskiales bacterium]